VPTDDANGEKMSNMIRTTACTVLASLSLLCCRKEPPVATHDEVADAGPSPAAASAAASGFALLDGKGVPKDDNKAAELFKLACDGKSPEGCGGLGIAYLDGRGVPHA
jgi:TPR repeat protein